MHKLFTWLKTTFYIMYIHIIRELKLGFTIQIGENQFTYELRWYQMRVIAQLTQL